MAKIRLICVFLLLSGCISDNSFDRRKYDMLFIYNPWIILDFETKILNVKYGELEFTDTLNFSTSEEKLILQSFEKSGIKEIEGEKSYSVGMIEMPPQNFTVKLFENRELKSQIIINKNFDKSYFVKSSNEYKIASFRDDVINVLSKNKEFRQAFKAFYEYRLHEINSGN